MILTLEVTGQQAAALGAACRHVFTTEGGIIGRGKTSDWTLSHTKVSGRHAVISYYDGAFYIEDTSTNGVFINSSKNRLVQGRRYALQEGDRILIDPYVIEVSVASDDAALSASGFDDRQAHAPGGRDLIGSAPYHSDDLLRPARPTPPAPRDRDTPQPVPSEEVDPLKLLGSDDRRTPPKRQAPTPQDLDQSPVAAHFAPPAIIPPKSPPAAAGPFSIPEGYDPLLDDFTDPGPPMPAPPPVVPAPRPAPRPIERQRPVAPVDTPEPETLLAEPPRPMPRPADAVRPTPPPAATEFIVTPPAPPPPPPRPAEHEPVALPPGDSSAGMAALLAGAGLASIPPSRELAGSFGQIFRVVVEGVMDVLRSRQQIKDEFRMRMTQFRPADNNPLKFSANVDDALHNLLVKRNPAYLAPVEAFEDAFDDLRNHQLAMLAGMRVAFEAMLAEFDPDRLEKEFDRQMKRVPLMGTIARLRYWDLYRDRRDALAKDPDDRFKKLFGEEFARAYEEQLARLKAESRARHAQDKGSRRLDP